MCVRLRQRPRRRRRSRLPRSGEPSPDRVARLRIDDPSTRSDGAPWDGAGHASERGLPGGSFHGAQARSGASSHGRPPGGGPRHVRAGHRGRGDVRGAARGGRAAPAAVQRGRGRLQRHVLGAAGRRGPARRPAPSHRGADHGRHRPAIPQRARRRHAGARDRRRRRLPGAAAPGPPRAVRHGRPVRHRRRPAARRLRRLCRGARRRPARAGHRGSTRGRARRAGRSLLPDRREVDGVPRGRRLPEVPHRERRGGRARDLQGSPSDGGRPPPAAGGRATGGVRSRGGAGHHLYQWRGRPVGRARGGGAGAGPGVGSRGAEHPGLRPVASR